MTWIPLRIAFDVDGVNLTSWLHDQAALAVLHDLAQAAADQTGRTPLPPNAAAARVLEAVMLMTCSDADLRDRLTCYLAGATSAIVV